MFSEAFVVSKDVFIIQGMFTVCSFRTTVSYFSKGGRLPLFGWMKQSQDQCCFHPLFLFLCGQSRVKLSADSLASWYYCSIISRLMYNSIVGIHTGEEEHDRMINNVLLINECIPCYKKNVCPGYSRPYYLCIENAKGYVLIAVYLFIYLFIYLYACYSHN